jgi:hypothetical protein
MNYEDEIDKISSIEAAEGKGHTENVSGHEEVERIADASRHPASVDPSKIDIPDVRDEEVEIDNNTEQALDEAEHNNTTRNKNEPKELESRYDKQVMDQVSESLSVLAHDDESRQFFSDVMSEFGEDNPSVEEIEDSLGEMEYDQDEIDEGIDKLESNHLISEGQLSDKAYSVGEFAAEVHRYLSDLRGEAEEAESRAEDQEIVSNAELDFNRNYFGRAAESLLESSDIENVAKFISPFDRSSAQQTSGDTNPLMAFMVSAEKGDRYGIGDITGYSSDESAAERVRQIAEEGYLIADDEGGVETTKAGEHLKSQVDSLYESFESVIEQEERKRRRIDRLQGIMQYRSEQIEAAEELDSVSRQMKAADNMDWSSSKELLKDSYSPMARKMSSEYDEDFNLDEKPRLEEIEGDTHGR